MCLCSNKGNDTMTKSSNAAGTVRILSDVNTHKAYSPTAAIVAGEIAAKDKENTSAGKRMDSLKEQVSLRVLQQTADVAAFIAFQGLDAWNKEGAKELRKALQDAKVQPIVAKRLTESAGKMLRVEAAKHPERLEAFRQGPEHVMSFFAAAGIKTQKDLIKAYQPNQAPKEMREKVKSFLKALAKSERDALLREVAEEIKAETLKKAEKESLKRKTIEAAKKQREARRAASAKPNAKGETVSAEAA